jgi:isopentenyl diphosphate isomerase/L-lactate dehydrogenase-like FMN-dependent dehydrogenase
METMELMKHMDIRIQMDTVFTCVHLIGKQTQDLGRTLGISSAIFGRELQLDAAMAPTSTSRHVAALAVAVAAANAAKFDVILYGAAAWRWKILEGCG